MKKIKLTISGMHCSSCGSNTERSLLKVSGVKEARVSLLSHSGFVECEDFVKEEDLTKAVSRAGYKVISIQEE